MNKKSIFKDGANKYLTHPNNKKGITLISLVITIVILLILAGVAINLAVDSDGLFSKAEEAKTTWNDKVAEEGGVMENLMVMMNSINGGTNTQPEVPAEPETPTLGEEFNDDMIGKSVEYSANGQEDWIILGEDPEKAGHILITTAEPVADGFNLYGGAEKWLSYEADMDEACSVYGGTIGEVEVEARSITMEDINAVTGFEKPESDTYTFGTESDYANKKVNYLYPKAGSTWGEYTGWKLPSEANETTFEENYYYYNDSKYYYNKDGSGQTVETTEHIDPLKGDLIWGTDNDFSYLVASRSVYLDYPYYARFGVARVDGGGANSRYRNLCFANADSVHEYGDFGSFAFRPVVSLPSDIPVREIDGVYSFDILD